MIPDPPADMMPKALVCVSLLLMLLAVNFLIEWFGAQTAERRREYGYATLIAIAIALIPLVLSEFV